MDKKYHVFRLRFTGPLHLSNARSDDYSLSERVIHSDTLYAALHSAWSFIGRTEWISPEPDFSISSLFPFLPVNGQQVLYFLPRPTDAGVLDQPPSSADQIKKLKGIEYLDLESFNQLLIGNLALSPDCLQGKFFSTTPLGHRIDFIQSSVIPRIMRPRDESKDTEIFYIERIYFKYQAGFYFLIDTDNDSILDQIRVGLSYLSENGLGTDRAIGHGKFEFEEDTITLSFPEKSEFMVSLGLFSPSAQDNLNGIFSTGTLYGIIKRGGWIGEPFNTYRKKSVYMVSEGSLLRIPSDKPINAGTSHDLRPDNTPNNIDHPIYRVGKTILLPIKHE